MNGTKSIVLAMVSGELTVVRSNTRSSDLLFQDRRKAISALFSISVWYVLLRLGVVVHVRSIFLTSVYSVAIWHGLIYIPQAVIGIYYSFDENLSLRFDLMNYFVGLMLLVFASAILVLGYLFAYIKTISRSRSWMVATGVVVGAGASCLLVPLAMVPTLYLIFNFGYWIGLLIG